MSEISKSPTPRPLGNQESQTSNPSRVQIPPVPLLSGAFHGFGKTVKFGMTSVVFHASCAGVQSCRQRSRDDPACNGGGGRGIRFHLVARKPVPEGHSDLPSVHGQID